MACWLRKASCCSSLTTANLRPQTEHGMRPAKEEGSIVSAAAIALQCRATSTVCGRALDHTQQTNKTAAAGANYTPASKGASSSTCTASQVVANAWAVGVAIAAMVPLTLLQTCRQWNLLVAAHCTVLDVVVQVTTSLLLITEWTRHLQSSCLLDASLQQPPCVCHCHCSTGYSTVTYTYTYIP